MASIGDDARSRAGSEGPEHGVMMYVACALVAFSAVPLFVFPTSGRGWLVLLLGLVIAAVWDRALLRELVPIAAGIGILTLIPAEPTLGSGMALFGGALALALLIPWVISRFVLKNGAVSFPFRGGTVGRGEWIFLALVPLLGYLILPAYFIGANGVAYWPSFETGADVVLLAIGILGLGLWEELFFVGVIQLPLRRHIGRWSAIALRALVVVPLLWSWGFQGIGWVIILVFALVQGWLFERTRSLPYVIAVHLTLDVVMILVLVAARNPQWADAFLTA